MSMWGDDAYDEFGGSAVSGYGTGMVAVLENVVAPFFGGSSLIGLVLAAFILGMIVLRLLGRFLER